jgi:hypothetical protein
VSRIGLPAETGKIEGTRSKLKRLVERGWLDEDAPGLFTSARCQAATSFAAWRETRAISI